MGQLQESHIILFTPWGTFGWASHRFPPPPLLPHALSLGFHMIMPAIVGNLSSARLSITPYMSNLQATDWPLLYNSSNLQVTDSLPIPSAPTYTCLPGKIPRDHEPKSMAGLSFVSAVNSRSQLWSIMPPSSVEHACPFCYHFCFSRIIVAVLCTKRCNQANARVPTKLYSFACCRMSTSDASEAIGKVRRSRTALQGMSTSCKSPEVPARPHALPTHSAFGRRRLQLARNANSCLRAAIAAAATHPLPLLL